MPTGSVSITPGKILTDKEQVSNAKLNQGFRPTGRVDPNSIGARELVGDDVRTLVSQEGKNLLCNGNFLYWPVIDDTPSSSTATLTGVVSGGRKHEYGSAARWVIANDTNRVATRLAFTPGQTEVPDNPVVYLRWAQSVAVAGSINPAYFGQRLALTPLANQSFLFTIWLRSSIDLSVVPSLRQMFGDPNFSPDADVVVNLAPVALVSGQWTKVKVQFDVPDIAGKHIETGYTPANPGPFTEFRIVLPQATVFTVDFAQAQLIRGTHEQSYDNRPFLQDWLEAQRFRARAAIYLSDNIATKHQPFVNFPIEFRGPIASANLSLTNVSSGTGATILADGNIRQAVVQGANHSVNNAQAVVNVDLEMHAPA